jgi:hypothetical protein
LHPVGLVECTFIAVGILSLLTFTVLRQEGAAGTKRGSPLQGLATIPEFLWELSFGVYLIVKGFKTMPASVAQTAGS